MTRNYNQYPIYLPSLLIIRSIYLMAIAELAKCTMLRGLFSTIPNGATIKNVFGKRTICSTTPLWKKKMPDRPAPIDEADFTEVFLHGSGPGGQKIVSLSLIESSTKNPQLILYRTKLPPQFS